MEELNFFGKDAKFEHVGLVVPSIDKAIKNNEKHEVLKHLVAIRTLNKSNKDLYDVLDKDVKYIQGKYFK